MMYRRIAIGALLALLAAPTLAKTCVIDADGGSTDNPRVCLKNWNGGNGDFEVVTLGASATSVLLEMDIGGGYRAVTVRTDRGGQADCDHSAAGQFCTFVAPRGAFLRVTVAGGTAETTVVFSGNDWTSAEGTSSDADTGWMADDAAGQLTGEINGTEHLVVENVSQNTLEVKGTNSTVVLNSTAGNFPGVRFELSNVVQSSIFASSADILVQSLVAGGTIEMRPDNDSLAGIWDSAGLGIEAGFVLGFDPTDAISDCSLFPATGGGVFFDDSEGLLKKCQDNVLTDLDTAGAALTSVTEDATDTIIEPPSDALIVRQSGGVAGTDEMEMRHDGTNFEFDMPGWSGVVEFGTISGDRPSLKATSTTFYLGQGANDHILMLAGPSLRILPWVFTADLTSGVASNGAGDWGLLASGQQLGITTEGVDVTDGKRLELPESSTAPTATESACYYDTDSKTPCCYDGAQWQCYSSVYGELYATSGTLTISTENVYAQWTATTAGGSGGGMTISTSTDDIVVPVAGDYKVLVSSSFSGGNNDEYECNVHEDGSPGKISFKRTMGTGGAVGVVSMSGSLVLAASAVLELFCRTAVGDGTDDMTISYLSMLVELL